ncbi:intersectin-2 isoform X1 [Tribolium castaneum]|uniref:intersectin-2 isoform X1 n=1 Tax=Tribolium castaneum TaxID=7070 RepID=UPI00046C1908|nr:PREDICTED: intersectin-2 isoform X1 [Tribolium castaneum]XP_015833272.1 PREDICTED: intersectin-2 isoform X1 [Tribolium castaneum]|eukprot:XP_008190947.1 PREDICTED: intersectin-2 isoform X1 [Tribolium castaneum]
MSAAGTPSTDPWVILARERARYEEQFKSLKPNNGVVTGEQAKGFFLQSQLPPLVLGQIWALADTDADGKMDVNEFSIACKLINLKLRGFEVPKALPPSLLASLKTSTPPAIPPLPNPALISAPPRPEPPKPALIQPQVPPTQPMLPVMTQPPIAGIPPMMAGIPPQPVPGIPTGIVPPMQSAVPQVQPMMGIPPQPLVNQVMPTTAFGAAPLGASIPPMPASVPLISGTTAIPTAAVSLPNVPVTLPNVPTASAAPIVPAPHMSPVGSVTGAVVSTVAPMGPGATSTPRSSIASLDKTASVESLQVDWAVPHQTKLKYTQIFNTTDRTRSGFLSGAQARNVMVQTKLPQSVLAQIWGLSDMDADGRLGCEEFVLAMHLCEQASLGNPPPAKLPPELIPPSFRRVTRTASISSQGSVPLDQDPASTLLQTSFEDKRKENFEKGQAELERRRKALLDQQRKEAEERERKEREEMERKEKARQEAERKRMEELERQMREQQEQERLKEEERKRQAEQREAARREMERQRQLEWEKQRLQELQQQRQKEQENVLRLKAKSQSLTIELTSLNDQVKELSQKICDTRLGVSNVKTTIDGMRSTRDSQMQEMSQLKNKLKEQNTKLLALSQEKIKLEAKNKLNAQMGGQDAEQAKIAFENKEITIKNLREKIEDMQKQIEGKLSDIENNNTQLTELRTQLHTLVSECEGLYGVYEEKKTKVLEMKNANRNLDYNASWKSNDAWGDTGTQAATEWPADNWGTSTAQPTTDVGVVRYRALYEFVARNSDEISFQPGDIINVPTKQTGEPGWLAGEIRGHTGWFPESYVEPVDGVGVRDAPTAEVYPEEQKTERLEGIPEVIETPNPVPEPVPAVTQPEETGEIEYYIANYPYQSQEQGDLTFNAGDVITVVKKDGDWWTGKIGNTVGIFPSNYVQKVDVNSGTNTTTANTTTTAPLSSAPESSNTPIDYEVSQINEYKAPEKPLDASITSNTQTLKGKKPEIASVIAPYQATSAEQLSLARGQLIMIRKKTDSGWWEGELQAKGRKRQVGWFPASYVKVLNSSGRASGRTTPVSTTRMQQEVVLDKVIALFPYTAGNPDELSFAKDDIISVTAREEEAWWRGELNGVSGLFPSNYVTPLQQQSTVVNKKRQDSIREFIQTEKVYVDDMTTVHEVFELPMKKSGVIGRDEVEKIFLNWQAILQCNRRFLSDLYDWTSSGSDILGPVISKHLQNMQVYEVFCGKQLDSAALLQKLTETSTAFRDLMRKCQNNVATKGMPLSSFLIKPMQRITRYPLLISKIIENTAEDHPDYESLQEALRNAEKFLNDINENVKLKENQERYDWLQRCVQNDLNIVFNSETNKLGPRKLIHFGVLSKVKSGKELIGFLFNDFFLLIQPSKSLGTQFTFQRNSNISYKMYKQPILIQDLSFSRESTDHVEQGTDSNRVIKIQDNKNKYTLSLLAPTVNECNLWVKRIEKCKEVYNKVDSLSQTRPKTIHSDGVWLKITVIRGREICSRSRKTNSLKKKGKPHTDNVYCKVTLGDQRQQTDLSKDQIINGNVPQNSAPQVPTIVWNYSMQFQLRNLETEVITFTVYGLNLYCPDEFLGRAELKIIDILRETQNTNGPITKKLILHQVESGEIVVKLDLQLFDF